MQAFRNNESDSARRFTSALIAGVSCLFALYLIFSPANIPAAMLPCGYLLSLVPLFLAPVQYFFVLRACGCGFRSGRLFPCTAYGGCFLIVFLICIFTSSIAGRLWLGSVDIPRQSLTSSDINALQDLQVEENAFSFEVRFSWERDRVRVVFRRGDGREQVLRARLRQCVDGAMDGVKN
jgi:hypothetical protein